MKKNINMQTRKKSVIKAKESKEFFEQMEVDFEEMDKLCAKFQAVVEYHLLPQTYKVKRVLGERLNRK